MGVGHLPDRLINEEVLQHLLSLYGSGRLAHAYLFSGPKGVGKYDTALGITQAVNCLESGGFKPGCRCASCRKIESGNHPDVYIVEKLEDKNELIIEQVRGLIQHFSLRPLEARVRTAIIKDADLLNTQASNAFLKTLEEPRPGTLLLLTSSSAGNILKTVVSRCHEVRFLPLEDAVLSGRPGHRSDRTLKNAIIDDFILGPAHEPLLKKWSADKDAARSLLEVVLLFYRDVLCVKNGVNDSLLYNSDRPDVIRSVADGSTVSEVQAVLGQAVKAVEAVEANFNVKVALTLLKELMSLKGDYGKNISYTGRRV